MEPKLLEFTRRREIHRGGVLHSQKETFSPRESTAAVVFRSEKDAIPITNEVNSVRNLVTGNGRRYGLLRFCLAATFALLVSGLAFGQTFVQIADNTPGSGTTTTFTNPEAA